MTAEGGTPSGGWLSEVTDLRVEVRQDGEAVPLVDRVSVRVSPGEAVGLVGESGCGKTLTVLAMAGMLPSALHVAEDSRVRFDGNDLADVKPAPHGAEIGFVFQDPTASLNPVLRVGEQIAEVVREVLGRPAREAARRAEALLAEVGIDDPVAKARSYPSQLSGGERQRVGIAAALAGDPRLLIADEPTTGVDMIVQAQILELLATLRERRGMSLVLVSHDLAVVAEVCDRVLVLYAGQVVEEGPVGKVLSRPDHPYAQGLIGCLPRLGAGPEGLLAIPGNVPLPGRWSTGCRFADRCGDAFEPCGSAPPMVRGREDRRSRCWLHAEGGGK